MHRAGEALIHHYGDDAWGSMTVQVIVEYADSRDTFPRVDLFVEAAAEVAIQRVQRITATLRSYSEQGQITLIADPALGAVVRVSGADDVFAHGARDVLRDMLEQNVPPPGTGVVRLRDVDWTFFNLGAALVALSVLLLLVGEDSNEPWSPVAGLLLGGLSVVLAFVTADRYHPPLTFVAVAEAEPPERWRPVLWTRDWLREHPLVAFLIGFAVAVASNLVADRL